MSRIPNGIIPSDAQHVSQLRRQLNDTHRQLLLSREVIQQLEKIHEIQNEIKDVSTRLIFPRDDIGSDDDTSRLYDLKNELKKYEKRLKVLKSVDNDGPQIDVQLMPCTKIKGNKYRFLDREVSITKDIARRDQSLELLDSDEETVFDDRNRHSSGTSDTKTAISSRTESVEEELRELNPKRKKSNRRSVIPQRFESFPSLGVAWTGRANWTGMQQLNNK